MVLYGENKKNPNFHRTPAVQTAFQSISILLPVFSGCSAGFNRRLSQKNGHSFHFQNRYTAAALNSRFHRLFLHLLIHKHFRKSIPESHINYTFY